MPRPVLDEALKWILSGHTKEFRKNFDVITAKYPSLDAEDLKVLRAIHAKGALAPEYAEVAPDVEGQDASRSHGW